MKKIIRYFHLNNIGIFELLFAFYPIIAGYKYSLPMFAIVLLAFDVWILFFKRKKIVFDKKIVILFVYVFCHELFLLATLPPTPAYFVNNFLSYLLVVVSIPIISSGLDFQKFVGALYFVSLICLGGLIYHFLVISAGGEVHPIKLPFMPEMESTSRLYDVMKRPSSFFWEPQSYCSFMFIPLFLAFKEKKILWAFTIIFSLLLSGSTTGIIMSFVVIAIYIFTQGLSYKTKYGILLLSVPVFFLFINLSLFQVGREKMMDTDINDNSRLYNGPVLVSRMQVNEFILGVHDFSASDYYMSGKTGSSSYLIDKYDTIYISTFWHVIVKFGLIGLIIYMSLYLVPLIRNRSLLLYLGPLIATLFSNPDFLGAYFAFEFIFIYSFLLSNNRNYSSR